MSKSSLERPIKIGAERTYITDAGGRFHCKILEEIKNGMVKIEIQGFEVDVKAEKIF